MSTAIAPEVPLREGEYGERILAIEPGGAERIPEAERHGNAAQLFRVWITPNLEFATLYVGVLPIVLFGGGFWLTVIAIILGNVVGSISQGVLTTLGPKLGVPQLVASRAPFGWWGNFLPAGLNAITAGAGWFAVNSVSGAFAFITALTLMGFAVPSLSMAIFIVIGIEVLGAVFGYNLIHRLQALLLPLLATIFMVSCAIVLAHSRPATGFNSGAPQAVGGPLAAFILATFLAYAYSASWNPYAADYARYLPQKISPWKAGFAAGMGLFLPCTFLAIAGAALATVPGTHWGATDIPTTQFTSILPRIIGIAISIAIVVGAVSANVFNLYSGALSTLAVSSLWRWRFRRAGIAIAIGLIGIFIALNPANSPSGSYTSFLFLSTYWVLPFVTVVIVDFWLRHGRFDLTQLFNHQRRQATGVVAMLCGIAASIPFWNQSLYTGWVASHYPATGDLSILVSPIVSGLVYFVLSRAVIKTETNQI